VASLERFDVKPFDAVGQPFDPARHEAIAQVESADQPPGTVVTEMQKGYTMGARLVRPAMVAVSRAPAAPAAEAKAEEPKGEEPKVEAPGAEGEAAAGPASKASD
jgi:molecular chaperone GrpE